MLFSFGKHKGFNIHIYNLSYSHTNNLALLLIIHIVVNPIICTECDFKSNDKLNPFPPITVENPIICTECDYKSNDKVNPFPPTTVVNPIICTECDYKSNFKLNPFPPITVGNPIICTECDFKSNDKLNIKIHLLQHIYEIPFLCMECDFNTYKKNIISFSHTGEFPISCNNYGEIYRTHTRILGVLLRKAIHIQYGQFRK